jgi:transketolase
LGRRGGGRALGWDQYVGHEGEITAMHSFGASAPAKDLMEKFGIATEALAAAARRQLRAQVRP